MNYVVDNFPKFSRSVEQTLDMGMGELAKDVLVMARGLTPFKQGQLRSDSDAYRESQMHWRVRYHKEYALAQEQGHANGRQFKNYTTAGTGKAFLKTAGDKVTAKALQTLKNYAGRARA